MNTTRFAMTGSPVAVAGAGGATFTPSHRVKWFVTDAASPTEPDMCHIAESFIDRSLDVPVGSKLWLIGTAGAMVAVTADTAP